MAEAEKAAACPHCGAELIAHEDEGDAEKAQAMHCNSCGCCFVDGSPRPGHPLCSIAARAEAEAAGAAPASAPAPLTPPEPEAAPTEEAAAPAAPTPRPRSTTR